MNAAIKEAIGRLHSLAQHLEMTDLPPFATADEKRQAIADLHTVTAALKEADSPKKSRNKVPPDPAEVTAYSAAIGYPLNGQAWCDHYSVKGWMVGRTRMVDWQAAIRLWKTNGWGENGIALGKVAGSAPRSGESFRSF